MEYWRKEYEQKLCTAEEAIKLIKSGDHLLVGGNRSRPEHIIKMLIEHEMCIRDSLKALSCESTDEASLLCSCSDV